MRGGAGDDLQLAGFEEAPEAVEKIVVVLLHEHVAAAREAVHVHLGQPVEFRLPARPFQFLAGQRDQVVDVANVAILQQRIGQHARQGRRDRHGQAPVGFVAVQPFEDFEQRNVGLGDRLVEPIFFEEVVEFGMPDIGQMGVQNECEIAERHNRASQSSRKNGGVQPKLVIGRLE